MAAEKTVICYGDSNTYGFDPRMGCPERLPRRVRWTGRLDALPGLRIINEGMNGREIPHTAAAFSYLDRILEEHDEIASSRDRHFKSLIRSFKSVRDADFEVPSAM